MNRDLLSTLSVIIVSIFILMFARVDIVLSLYSVHPHIVRNEQNNQLQTIQKFTTIFFLAYIMNPIKEVLYVEP
ncbi:MAG: hypothetical protein ABUJ92_15045, partial [Desulfobacterales bacterium]